MTFKDLNARQGRGSLIETPVRETELVGMSALSVLLISPDDIRRHTLAVAVAGPQANIAREITRYPLLEDLAEIEDADYDLAIVDLDPNPEHALDVVENLCAGESTLTVIAYAACADADLLMRCMRAGAREFLTDPLVPGAIAEALVRASARRDELRRHKKVTGKLLVFAGAKGGSGVTTIASNFALALSRQSHSKVALLDLDLQLGDAALTLGLTAKFSFLDALEHVDRLDLDLLSALMIRHKSGLQVLAAPDAIPTLQPSKRALEKLVRIARENFAYVIVDAGAHPVDVSEWLFDTASAVYLVTQVGVTDLRNANRFISWYFNDASAKKLEIVLNRFAARNMEIDEGEVTKVLTRPATWKIPNDFNAVRRAQNTGIPVASENGSIARALAEMAAAASGRTAPPKKKKFSLFG